MIDSIVNKFSEQLNNSFEKKLRECCNLWGVDVTNPSEVSERCSLVTREWSDLKEVYIDGNIVMYYTDWNFDNSNIENGVIKADFKCSKIMTPEDYKVK